MISKLNIVAIQTPIFWENAPKNKHFIDQKLRKLETKVDIVLLPEMFTTGFTMKSKKVAEDMHGPTIQWMQDWAKKLGILLGGSLVIRSKGKIYNRFVMVGDKGVLAYYDKRHTFTLAGEDKFYANGTNSGLFRYKGWKICLRICYDLRFPVWSRNTKNYDLLIYVANWPVERINAWDTLLQARAIENMCYVVGVNRVGTDYNKLVYPGHSAIYNPLGKVLAGGISNNEENFKAELNFLELQELRKQLNFLDDRDNFDLY
jgi:predicted amidohydrolase